MILFRVQEGEVNENLGGSRFKKLEKKTVSEMVLLFYRCIFFVDFTSSEAVILKDVIFNAFYIFEQLHEKSQPSKPRGEFDPS